MPLYDFLAPAYDPVFEKIYRPFRTRALESLALQPGACVLDLACGTGQNFPLLAAQIGPRGQIIGLDISHGMLRRARRRTLESNVSLIRADATALSSELLETHAGVTQIDAVLSTYGFTSMANPESAFHAAWNVLKPGGIFLIHDIHAPTRTLHARAVEFATRSHFAGIEWRLLEAACTDFRMDYLDPSAHLFGGRLFVARGKKSPP